MSVDLPLETSSRKGTSNGSHSRLSSESSTGRCSRLDLGWLLDLADRRRLSSSRRGSFVSDDDVPRRSIIAENKIIDYLLTQGFTAGLARTLVRNTDMFDLRIWLVDNSGSMNDADGHLCVQSAHPPYQVRNIDCTRWEEVASTVQWHANFAAMTEAPMVLRLLNDPGATFGPQQLGVAASERVDVAEELKQLKHLFQSRPGGTTPLTVHLKDIIASLSRVNPRVLKERLVAIVIVTDGLPTDAEGEEGDDVNREFIETLKELESFPVWVVIRLSTDEQRVVDFYGALDGGVLVNDHENSDTSAGTLHLDVLDDFVSEATEVHKHNPWLNYGYPLHLCRESCVNFPAFDALNDRPLRHDELADVICLLFDIHNNVAGGQRTWADQPLPSPATEYTNFRNEVRDLITRGGGQWSPIKRKMMPWVNLTEMDRIYGDATAATCSCTLL